MLLSGSASGFVDSIRRSFEFQRIRSTGRAARSAEPGILSTRNIPFRAFGI
jgi:hypothetical protein